MPYNDKPDFKIARHTAIVKIIDEFALRVKEKAAAGKIHSQFCTQLNNCNSRPKIPMVQP